MKTGSSAFHQLLRPADLRPAPQRSLDFGLQEPPHPRFQRKRENMIGRLFR